MTIKEIYLPITEDDGTRSWVDITVMHVYKATVTRIVDGNTFSGEQMVVSGYYMPTGEIIECPLNEVIIKTLYDEKSGKSTNFGAPDGYDSGAGKKDRKYLYPDNNPA